MHHRPIDDMSRSQRKSAKAAFRRRFSGIPKGQCNLKVSAGQMPSVAIRHQLRVKV